VWHGALWAIDHGACLYFHHSWTGGLGAPERFARQPYSFEDHVLAAHLPEVPRTDAALAPRVTRELLEDVVARVPEEWVEPVPDADTAAVRAAYVEFLLARVGGDRPWLAGARP
jgi:hypothetical protein